MADNTQLNVPDSAGNQIADLDVGGVHHQKVVIEHLGAGSTPLMASNANPLPITMPAGVSTETTLAAILAKIIAAPATEAKQDTGNTSLSSIDGKFTTLNAKDFATQTTLAAILAKIIASPATAANQTTEIASLASIDSKLTSPITVVGTVNANTGLSQPLTDTQLRATPVPVSGTVAVSNFPATQPVSAAALPLPTGASTETTLASILAKIIASPATEATLALIKAKTDNIDVALSTRTKPADTQLVNTGLSQPLTDTQLRAVPVPVSGTFFQATQPVSVSSLTAANTKPLPGDTGLVVSLSPNSSDLLRTNYLLEQLLLIQQSILSAIQEIKEPGKSYGYELRSIV
jgi:hypothetical protein